MGVVFFPSLPFMGVMLFLSFVLGIVSGEGGTFLMLFSLFSILLSLPLLSSLSPSPSFSLPSLILFFSHLILFFFSLLFFHILFSLFPFLSHKLFPSLFSSSPLFHLVFLSSLSLDGAFFFFFLREQLVLCTFKM